MTALPIDNHLCQIFLDQKQAGFENFITCWVYKSQKLTFLVDPGPKHSIRQLIRSLTAMGITKIDYILLTHIHIDHSGGAGALLNHYPDARIICHPKAVPHMVSPHKLWQGSLKTLGKIAESYGEILPVPRHCIVSSHRLETLAKKISAIETPGHAAHHLSFQFQNYLFAGEAAGFTCQLEEGVYTRPSTPPRFELNITLASIDRIIPLDVSVICFGHSGYRRDVETALIEARNQLLLWVEVTRDLLESGKDDITDRTIPVLIREDAAFANIRYLPPKIRQREFYFAGNSIRGIAEYLYK